MFVSCRWNWNTLKCWYAHLFRRVWMSEARKEKKLIILYVDFTDEELKKASEDLFFALSCVTDYKFLVTNKRMESISLKEFESVMTKFRLAESATHINEPT